MKIKSLIALLAVMTMVSLSGCSWFKKAPEAGGGTAGDTGQLEMEIGGSDGSADTGDLEMKIGNGGNGDTDTGDLEIKIGE